MKKPYTAKTSTKKKNRKKRLYKHQNGACCWDYVGGPCLYRGQLMTRIDRKCPRFATFEHIKPKSLGGTFKKENIKLAHRECNVKRGNSV